MTDSSNAPAPGNTPEYNKYLLDKQAADLAALVGHVAVVLMRATIDQKREVVQALDELIEIHQQDIRWADEMLIEAKAKPERKS
jgi:hypothetical protein